MDRRERANDIEEALRVAMDGRQAGIWTALPGIIESFNATAVTAVVQPAIQGFRKSPTGTKTNANLPLLLDCPVVFPAGGGFTLTFPVAQGDECLVVFSSRCIDAWWASGGTQPAMEIRMHDLSDGFALVGVRSQARKLSNVSTTTTQLRSDDGEAYVEMAAGHVANIVAPGGVNITANVNITGTVTATGEGTFNGGHTVSQHEHPGVTTGTGTTQKPTG